MNRDENFRRRQAGIDRRKQEWIEAYREMRSAGFNHQAIARDLGIQLPSLLRTLARAGVYVPETYERTTYTRLDELIASGRPFSSNDLPESGQQIRIAAINRARRAGRITVVHKYRVSPCGSHDRNIYQAAQEDSCLRTA